MALKDFCKSLQICAEKLEAELRININHFNNLMHDKTFNDTKVALEEAKNYHFTEIIEAAGIVIEKVKVIVFHQEKLDWLSKESNFNPDYLKRSSYVKRQIYTFNQQLQQNQPIFSRSEENISVPYKEKRERRRTVSDVSLDTLKMWENYLDQKQKRDIQVEEVNNKEVKKAVPKRSLSNARTRKKFVSSTFGGFLDGETNKIDMLESIVEDLRSDGENSVEINELVLGKNKSEHSKSDYSLKNDVMLQNILDKFLYTYDKLEKRLSRSCGDLTDSIADLTFRSKSNDNLPETDTIFMPKETSIGETGNINKHTVEETEKNGRLPKIIDVVYKSNSPSNTSY